MTTETFCTLETLAAEETIFGTAGDTTRIWFLLEYTDPWRPEVENDNDLPEPVQTWFSAHLADLPGSRLFFIKRPSASANATTRRFYVAVSTPTRHTLHAFEVETYAELLWLDVAAIVAGDEKYAAYQTDETLFLVCTHGKRDKCCAKFGRPVYEALAELAPAQTWESSHLGGHRYAAVTAVLPAGLSYGFMSPDVVPQLYEATQRNEIVAPHFRGHAYYPVAVQAADYFLRRELNEWQNGCVQLLEHEVGEHGRVTVRFQHEANTHTVTLTMRLSEPVLAGCTANKKKPRPFYELVSIT